MLRRNHGKGTFVLSTNPIEFQLGGIVSFQETYPRLGNDVSTEVVELTQIPLEGALLEHINAEPGTPITRVMRVRRIDGKRVILDINHFVSAVIPGLSRTRRAVDHAYIDSPAAPDRLRPRTMSGTAQQG